MRLTGNRCRCSIIDYAYWSTVGVRRSALYRARRTVSRARITGQRHPMLRPISCDQGREEQAVEVFLTNLPTGQQATVWRAWNVFGTRPGRDEARFGKNQISNTGTDQWNVFGARPRRGQVRKESNIEHRHRSGTDQSPSSSVIDLRWRLGGKGSRLTHRIFYAAPWSRFQLCTIRSLKPIGTGDRDATRLQVLDSNDSFPGHIRPVGVRGDA